MTKAELRLHCLARLRAWTADRERRRAASEVICGKIMALPAWREARMICAFLALPSEPRLEALWSRADGPAFCFPRVRGTMIELICPADRAALSGANWTFAGPDFADAPTIAPSAVDLFLVPGVAFTPDGKRLGRGAGYYDRLLAGGGRESLALGICFAVQLTAELPLEAHDQKVDAVLTEAPASG